MRLWQWNMVLWYINICNDGWNTGGVFDDTCTLKPAAKAYFASKGLPVP